MNTVIRTVNLNKSFNGVKAVNNLNISVPKGSIYGFLGPNGAGKTTTLKMMTGMLKPDEGDIFLDEHKMTYGKYEQYRNIGFLPDVPEYYNYMNAKEFLRLCGNLFGIEKRVLEKRIKDLLDLTGISTNKKIKGYSRGMKQRLGIAQALINEPQIVFLDEPTSALDPLGRKDILDLVVALKEKTTVLFSTHILADVERICDRIAIMDGGNIVLEDTIEGLKAKHIKNKIILKTDSNEQAVRVLQNEPWLSQVEIGQQMTLAVNNLKQAMKEIPGILWNNNLSLYEFRMEEPTLEELFVKVVKEQ